ncbi:MAG: topoisomerase DNA-binding C4 zinc finger domain-containing protein [Candidatus Hermodarchaeota archaeon]
MTPKDEDVPTFCPKCGKPLKIRKGTYGTYLDCTEYPNCKYMYEISAKKRPTNDKKGISKCPRCDKKLAIHLNPSLSNFALHNSSHFLIKGLLRPT